MSSQGGDLAAVGRHERLLDMEARLRVHRLRALGVLAVALLAAGPWVGFWFLLPLAAAGAGFSFADRRMRTSPRPHRWASVGWALSGAMIAGGVALTGAYDSPAVMWLALPAVTLGTRFERRGVVCGVAYLLVLLALCTLAIEPGEVLARPQHFLAPVALVIAMAILSGAAQESDREHRRVAVLDPLTGLLNRAALLARFEELEQLARRGDHASVGLLVGDLDHFKRVNDERGHPTGDAVLKDVAYALRKTLRAFDNVYRIGGEEFVVVLPGADRDQALEIGERLRAAVADSRTGDVAVTMSVGAATAHGAEVRFGELYAAADAALYAAKRAGRDCVRSAGARAAVPA